MTHDYSVAAYTNDDGTAVPANDGTETVRFTVKMTFTDNVVGDITLDSTRTLPTEDQDGDSLTFTGVNSDPTYGTVRLSGGTLTYAQNQNTTPYVLTADGTYYDTFTLTASYTGEIDGYVSDANRHITPTVRVPITVHTTYTHTQPSTDSRDTSFTIFADPTQSLVLGNYANESLTFEFVSATCAYTPDGTVDTAQVGTISTTGDNASSSWEWTPPTDASGNPIAVPYKTMATWTVQTSDADGQTTDLLTLTIDFDGIAPTTSTTPDAIEQELILTTKDGSVEVSVGGEDVNVLELIDDGPTMGTFDIHSSTYTANAETYSRVGEYPDTFTVRTINTSTHETSTQQINMKIVAEPAVVRTGSNSSVLNFDLDDQMTESVSGTLTVRVPSDQHNLTASVSHGDQTEQYGTFAITENGGIQPATDSNANPLTFTQNFTWTFAADQDQLANRKAAEPADIQATATVSFTYSSSSEGSEGSDVTVLQDITATFIALDDPPDWANSDVLVVPFTGQEVTLDASDPEGGALMYHIAKKENDGEESFYNASVNGDYGTLHLHTGSVTYGVTANLNTLDASVVDTFYVYAQDVGENKSVTRTIEVTIAAKDTNNGQTIKLEDTEEYFGRSTNARIPAFWINSDNLSPLI